MRVAELTMRAANHWDMFFVSGIWLEQGMRKVPVRHTLNDNFGRVDFRLSGFSPTRNFGPYPGGFRYNRYAHFCRLCKKDFSRA